MGDPQIHSTGTKVFRETHKEDVSEQSASDSGLAVPVHHPLLVRLLAAGFYGCASFLIVVVNKVVLTSYKFPSFQFLGVGQMVTGVVLLYTAKSFGIISFPSASVDTFRKVWPLPLFYIGNLVFGLGGTKKLSLPMFTVLRRFSIFLTMAAEYYVLGVQASRFVQLTVFLMIFGAVIAASTDLAFDFGGYTFIMLNNICTAANGVYTKKKLESKNVAPSTANQPSDSSSTEDLGKYGLLYYNSLLMLLPAVAATVVSGELDKSMSFEQWQDPSFLLGFLLSCVMGFILNYSIILCTAYNSALTTTIVGVLKNLLVTYLGIIIGGDYVFSILNFIGINISVAGSLLYSYVTFSRKPSTSSNPSTKSDITSRR